MIGAVIRSGRNTLVVDLPTGMMDLQTKLSSIGIDRTAENINLSDEDGDRIRVKLYATEPEEAHLLSLLTPDRTLADANSSMMLLQRANQNSLPRLKCCLLGDNYRSLEDFINDAKQVFTRERTVDRCTQAMQRFEEDPNIRAVVSCVHDNEIEMLLLPLSDRQLEAENVRLEELGASCTLKIEALRYGKPWQDIFADVLDNEGLAAVNSLAAAFPYMEEAQKLATVVEYADAYDSRSVIKLAERLDRRALSVPDQHDRHRVHPQRLQARPQKGLRDHHGEPEHRGLSDPVDPRVHKAPVLDPDATSCSTPVRSIRGNTWMLCRWSRANMSDVTETIDSISDAVIQYDNVIVRKLIECIRVISADEIEIVFKGMQPRRYSLKQAAPACMQTADNVKSPLQTCNRKDDCSEHIRG